MRPAPCGRQLQSPDTDMQAAGTPERCLIPYKVELKCRHAPARRGQGSAALQKTTFLKIGGKVS